MQHLELMNLWGLKSWGPHTAPALPCTYSLSRRLGLSRFHTRPTLSGHPHNLLTSTSHSVRCWGLYLCFHRGDFPFRDSNPAPRRQGASSPHDHFNPSATAAEPALSPMASLASCIPSLSCSPSPLPPCSFQYHVGDSYTLPSLAAITL